MAYTELDFVELTTAVGDWPAGTRGTLVLAKETGGLIEISDDDGVTLELLGAPYSAMRVVVPFVPSARS